jgi:hypothetical protein
VHNDAIAAHRLRNQHIATGGLDDPSGVVASLGAVQSQDYLGGLWAVGLRTRGATQIDVERALASRSILRTWPMRGTLHFVAPSDVRWMLELLASRVIAATAVRARQLELDAAAFSRSRKVVARALEGDRQLTRTALYNLLDAAGISTADGRGLHIVCRLALEGLICFGAHEGRQPTLALLADWAPQAKTMDREASLAELARRYFTGHGPATWRDFAWWSGLRAAEAREAVHLARPHLTPETIGGQEFWRGTMVPRAKAAALGAAYILPPFDEYTVAYRDRTAVLHARHAPYAQFGGMLSPTIVIGGRVVGTWKRRMAGNTVVVEPTFFGRCDGTHARLLTAAIERYARFLGAVPRMAPPRQSARGPS